jgi:hypothetical protein
VPPGTVPQDPAEQYQWLRVQWALVDSWIGARKAQAGLPDPAAALAAEPVPGEPVSGEDPSPGGGPVLDGAG